MESIVHTILWIMIGLIIVITLFLIIIYIKSKTFRSYPCYLNIILSSVILIDNLLRLIPMDSKENDSQDPEEREVSFLCNIQAFLLSVFDKLMLTSMTINSYLTYVGFTNNEFYKAHIKTLFIVCMILSSLLSIILAFIFLVDHKPVEYGNVCYVWASPFKEQTDAIVTIVLAAINFFCITSLLLHISNTIKEIVTFRNKNDYSRHYYRIIASLFINAITFLIVVLIIGDSLFVGDDYIDLCYIVDALVVDLFYTCNKTVINETKKLFGYKTDDTESVDDETSEPNE